MLKKLYHGKRALSYPSVRSTHHRPFFSNTILSRSIKTSLKRDHRLSSALGTHPIASDKELRARISYEDVRRAQFYIVKRIPLLRSVIYKLWRKLEVYITSAQLGDAFDRSGKEDYFPYQFLEGAKLSLDTLINTVSNWVPKSSKTLGDQVISEDEYRKSVEKGTILEEILSPGLYKKIEDKHLELAELGLVARFDLLNIHYVKTISSFTSFGPQQVLSSTILPIKAIKKRKNVIPGGVNYTINNKTGVYRCISAGFKDLVVKEDEISSLLQNIDPEKGPERFMMTSGRILSFDLEFAADIKRALYDKNTNSEIELPEGQRMKYKTVIRLETEYVKSFSKPIRWIIADVDNYLQDLITSESGDPLVSWIREGKATGSGI